MILAQVRKLVPLYVRAAKDRGQQFERLLHVRRERKERRPYRNGSRMQPACLQRHQRMYETVRACQQRIQLVHLLCRRPRLRAHPVDRCFQVRARHACSKPRAIEFASAGGFLSHKGFGEGVKIFPVSFEHIGNPLGNLSSFPSRPDPVRKKRERAACSRVDSARPDQFLRRDSGDGDQQNDEGADGHGENPIVCRAHPAQQEREYKDQNKLDRYGVRKKAKERGGQKKSCDRSGNPQEAAAERSRKFRLQHENDRHWKPVGAVPVETAFQPIAESDERCQTDGVPKHGRL